MTRCGSAFASPPESLDVRAALFVGGDLRVREQGHERDAAEYVAEPHGQNEAREVSEGRELALERGVNGLGRAGDDVRQVPETHDVADHDDDERARRSAGEHPNHERDEPAGKYRSREVFGRAPLRRLPRDGRESAPNLLRERVAAVQRGRHGERAGEVANEYDA